MAYFKSQNYFQHKSMRREAGCTAKKKRGLRKSCFTLRILDFASLKNRTIIFKRDVFWFSNVPVLQTSACFNLRQKKLF